MNTATDQAINSARVTGSQLPSGKYLSLLLAVLLLISCTSHNKGASRDRSNCTTFMNQLDSSIEKFTFFNPGIKRIEGQPLLRTNRFLSSFKPDQLSSTQHQDWLAMLNRLAIENYQIEFTRLPADEQQRVIHLTDKPPTQSHDAAHPISTMVANCFEQSKAHVKIDEEALDIPDSYSFLQKFFGIYPLTSWLAQGSIDEYRSMMTKKLQTGNAAPFESIVRYGPVLPNPEAGLLSGSSLKFNRTTLSQWIKDSKSGNSLGIPLPKEPRLNQLFRLYAPTLEIDTQSIDDRPGRVELNTADKAEINTNFPQAYTYLSHTRLQDNIYLQLNYVYWFPARTAEGSLDIYAGDLDGLIWRITLNDVGMPILYDTIHPCGCYHTLFIPPETTYRPNPLLPELPLIQALKAPLTEPEGAVLRIEAGTHYIISAYYQSFFEQLIRYELADYNSLLKLQSVNGPRSMFGSNGISDQSKRLERLLLWPLGVPNAGAMRQRGKHAIAFIGERHFDDAHLLQHLGIRIP